MDPNQFFEKRFHAQQAPVQEIKKTSGKVDLTCYESMDWWYFEEYPPVSVFPGQ
jgi:hypothetical protein